MELKWIGALLILAACGGFCFSVASRYKTEERILLGLIQAINIMESEVEYRLTTLPELLIIAGNSADKNVRGIFRELSNRLRDSSYNDPETCMADILSEESLPYPSIRRILKEIGGSLGKYDLPGQLRALSYVRSRCQILLESLNQRRNDNLRCYQTLSISAGISLVILFL